MHMFCLGGNNRIRHWPDKINPAESSDTQEGRVLNRRVIVSILASKGIND